MPQLQHGPNGARRKSFLNFSFCCGVVGGVLFVDFLKLSCFFIKGFMPFLKKVITKEMSCLLSEFASMFFIFCWVDTAQV